LRKEIPRVVRPTTTTHRTLSFNAIAIYENTRPKRSVQRSKAGGQKASDTVWTSHVPSVHFANESVDSLFAVAHVTTLNVMLKLPLPPSSSGGTQFERPQEIVCLLEIRSNSVYFVDEVFDRKDIVFAKSLLNDGVVGKGWRLRSVGREQRLRHGCNQAVAYRETE